MTKQVITFILYDGHKSHISLILSDWARKHKVTLFVLPPLSSHLTQPLDVAVFGPFKAIYNSECQAYMKKFLGANRRGWTGGYPIPSSLPLSPHFPPPSPPLPSPFSPTSLPLSDFSLPLIKFCSYSYICKWRTKNGWPETQLSYFHAQLPSRQRTRLSPDQCLF